MTDLLRRRRLAGDEGGFTLIEVIVALVIFTMILATTVSMLIASTKASLIAKMDTGAKNLAQERVEQVRNLPFHKDHPMSGAVPSAAEADDLLDTYFLSYSATDAACKVTGFVHGGTATASTAPPAGSVRCTYFGDPATGDFYRVASNPVAGYPRYAQYITTQFLPPGGAAGTPLTVPSTYNTQGDPASADVAVSDLVGIRVTTLWSVGSTSKKNSIFSLISQGRPAPTSVAFSSRGAALQITGRLDASSLFDSQVGVVSADGSATRNTTAATTAQSAFVSLAPGDRVNGSCALSTSGGAGTACASPSSTGGSLSDATGNLVGSFATTVASGAVQSTAYTLPQVGTSDATGNPSSLVVAGLSDTGSAPGLSGQAVYGATPVAPVGGYMGPVGLRMNTGKPLVYIDRPASSASSTVCGNASAPTITGKTLSTTSAFGATYGTTVTGSSHFSSTCVAVQASGLHLFPTDFAPQGIVLLSFTAQATCRTNGGLYNAATNVNGGRGLASYSGTAQVWNATTQSWGSAVSFSPAAPLGSVLPVTTALPGVIGLTIGSYVSSWSSASSADVTNGILIDQDNNAVSLKYANLTRIDSQVLGADPSSSFGVLLGNISCNAEDNR